MSSLIDVARVVEPSKSAEIAQVGQQVGSMHIHYAEGYSNYRLRNVSMRCAAVVTRLPIDAEGTCVWGDEGGACADYTYVEMENREAKVYQRVRGGRKQAAAKMYIPKESIKVVPLLHQRTPIQAHAVLVARQVTQRQIDFARAVIANAEAVLNHKLTRGQRSDLLLDNMPDLANSDVSHYIIDVLRAEV